ncbi:MAG: T9SS type A sorting domain-containing protein [Chitinophagaceae bacterium]|nr:T9SS type A sorting domain-containing protein [Chitinophagaceae bacterium]
MKKLYTLLIALAIFFLLPADKASAQCPGGYTSAQLNWDNLDYYWNSGGVGPYQSYITDAMEQSQRFAIGKTWLTIAASSNALANPGSGISAENATHTGELVNYTGADVQYNPSANGQSITVTFNTAVSGPNFVLYDVDDNAVFTITATNNLGVATTVNIVGGANHAIGGIPTARTITAIAGDVATSSNNGSATITVPGLVNSITITATTIGTNPIFWLSDINACVSGTFPTNWHQGANNRPFVGPTQNQAEYFLVTPDNNSCYYVDPTTAVARELFTDAARDFINSFAYDPYNRFLYYISEDITVNPSNRELKRYSYDTETSSVVMADMQTTLGIPTFEYGIESAGAAFYDGALYFGVEGGKYNPSGTANDRTRETIIWRIDFDGSNNPVSAYQVFAQDHYLNASNTAIHDWGDFIMKNGVIYNYNTARNSSNYSQSKYQHYDLMTGQMLAVYNNPGTTSWNGQAAMIWSGQLYYFRDNGSGNSGIGTYNEAGVNGAITNITVASGPAWPGNAGDASDPFRPKCDFGDAPATYDPYITPATQSPAVHERTDSIRLGTTWNLEYWKRGTTGTDDTDDGIPSTAILPPGAGSSYVVQVSAYNNSGADATMIAWLDYNGNGTFDAAEAITPITVPSSASAQNFWLYWASSPNTFANGQYTYLRVRITSASASMTTSHATGFFTNGEVEDYRILVDNFPLATHLLNFDAVTQGKKVKLNWSATEDAGTLGYEIERSNDNISWNKIETVHANGTSGTFSYESFDASPLKGVSYYRLRLIESSGMNRFSPVKKVIIKDLESVLTIGPNPAKDNLTIRFESIEAGDMEINILDMQGRMMLSKKQRVTTGSNNISFPLPETISTGTYVARIIVGSEVVHKKLIVNR